MNEEEKLDALLRNRYVKPASPNLAARIILQASRRPQIENISFWQSLRGIFAEFSLPKPAYVLSAALLIGMAAGFGTMPNTSALQDTSSVSSQSLISGDEALL